VNKRLCKKEENNLLRFFYCGKSSNYIKTFFLWKNNRYISALGNAHPALCSTKKRLSIYRWCHLWGKTWTLETQTLLKPMKNLSRYTDHLCESETSLGTMGILIGETTKLGWLIGLVKLAIWADSLYFIYLLLLSISKGQASSQYSMTNWVGCLHPHICGRKQTNVVFSSS
jgi:hypothetical protein